MTMENALPDLASAEKIANAVLYEGYILYPYRPSSVKNRHRWTFGGVYPDAYSAAQHGAEPASQQTQVLVSGDDDTQLNLGVRFLHLVARQVIDANNQPVESLRADGKTYHTWQEAVERQVDCPSFALGELCGESKQVEFAFLASCEMEFLREQGLKVGSLVRTQDAVQGAAKISAEKLADGLYRLTVVIENFTALEAAEEKTRDEAALSAFVSTHTILGVTNGELISLIDPPAADKEYAAACQNIGTYPVMVGEADTHTMMLSSPIILYDYPQIAPESAGDLFDGTEIDEILSLRILTLTDDEKQELRESDARGAAMLERTEGLSPEAFARLHGTLRHAAPADDWAIPTWGEPGDGNRESDRVQIDSVQVQGVTLRAGDAVRIRPKRSADAFDMLLEGHVATIESIEQDFDERIYLALTVNDDPGRDLGTARFIAHRFFYTTDEVEPL